MVTAIITILAGLLVATAERFHGRRIAAVARLAFGPAGRPAAWTRVAPAVRTLGFMGATAGALILLQLPVGAEDDSVNKSQGTTRLVICYDVSPSMHIKDAGPDAVKVRRAERAGHVLMRLIESLDPSTRVSLVGFYSNAAVILQDTSDRSLVANALDGLPMHAAFKPGPTNMSAGIDMAFEVARPWPARSATLIVVGDGDVNDPLPRSRRPSSIADVLVVGLGDPARATVLAGHGSRQDAAALSMLAARLGGRYVDANRAPLPTGTTSRFSMRAPNSEAPWGQREVGLFLLGSGAAMIALIGPALQRFGVRGSFAPSLSQGSWRTVAGGVA